MTETPSEHTGIVITLGGTEQVTLPDDVSITREVAEAINFVSSIVSIMRELETHTHPSQIMNLKSNLKSYIEQVQKKQKAQVLSPSLEEVLKVDKRLRDAQQALKS